MTQLTMDSEAAGTDTLTLSRPVIPSGASRTTSLDKTSLDEPSLDEPGSTNQEKVQAVLVERADGTCVLYGRGQSGTWPSLRDARAAFEEMSPHLAWRETTPGVWVARADANDAPTREGKALPNRRASSVPPKNRPSGTDTYMTARVIRGIARTGPSHSEQAVLAS